MWLDTKLRKEFGLKLEEGRPLKHSVGLMRMMLDRYSPQSTVDSPSRYAIHARKHLQVAYKCSTSVMSQLLQGRRRLTSRILRKLYNAAKWTWGSEEEGLKFVGACLLLRYYRVTLLEAEETEAYRDAMSAFVTAKDVAEDINSVELLSKDRATEPSEPDPMDPKNNPLLPQDGEAPW